MEQVDFLVIGGDAAGMTAASAIRRARKGASLLVLEKGPYVSYAACGIPYFLGGEIPELSSLEVFTAERFLKERDIQVRNGCEALAIDPQSRTVRARDASGSEVSLGYGRLLIATGANPILPPWPGCELRGVQPLRHLDDAKRAEEALKKASRAVVVGGGYVGLEVAENLRKRGLEVTLLEKAAHLMGGLNGSLSDAIAARLGEEQVEVRTGVTVTGFAGDGGALKAVITDAGEVPADFAIVSLGVRPNVHLAQEAGLTLGESGAIAVDDHLRTSDPHIYAAGDCTEAMHRVSGKPTFVPLALGANRGGRVAGENMAGGDARFPGIVGSAVTKVYDLVIARTGLLEPDLARLQLPYAVAKTTAPSKAHYYPGHVPVHVELTYPFAAFRTLSDRPYEGNKYAAVFWEHNFRTVPFEIIGWRWPVQKNISILLHGASGRTWLDEQTLNSLNYIPQYQNEYHHEIGASINGIMGLFRVDFTQRLDQRDFFFGIGLARLF